MLSTILLHTDALFAATMKSRYKNLLSTGGREQIPKASTSILVMSLLLYNWRAYSYSLVHLNNNNNNSNNNNNNNNNNKYMLTTEGGVLTCHSGGKPVRVQWLLHSCFSCCS